MSDYLHIYVDIETIPSLDPVIIAEFKPDLDSIVPDGRLKDPDKIADDVEKKRAKAIDDADAAYRKTSFDGATNHIASISYAADTGKIMGFQNASLPQPDEQMPDFEEIRKWESLMLRNFFCDIEREIEIAAIHKLIAIYKDEADHPYRASGRSVLSAPETDDDLYKRAKKSLDCDPAIFAQPIIVAHHAQFDIRIIWQRAVALGVAVPSWWPVAARPWDTTRIDDTMLRWAGATGRISLDKLCRALGLPGKSGFDGSQVWDAIRDGLIGEALEYCCDDVARLRLAHRKMLGLPLLDADIEQLLSSEDRDDAQPSIQSFINVQLGEPYVRSEGGAA